METKPCRAHPAKMGTHRWLCTVKMGLAYCAEAQALLSCPQFPSMYSCVRCMLTTVPLERFKAVFVYATLGVLRSREQVLLRSLPAAFSQVTADAMCRIMAYICAQCIEASACLTEDKHSQDGRSEAAMGRGTPLLCAARDCSLRCFFMRSMDVKRYIYQTSHPGSSFARTSTMPSSQRPFA